MAGVTFNYSGATYGRSAAGLQKLTSNLQGDVKRACEAMSGSEYNKFINMVRKNWSGVDAEAFIKKFKADVEAAKKKIKANSSKIEATLLNDNKAFRKMQRTNINKI